MQGRLHARHHRHGRKANQLVQQEAARGRQNHNINENEHYDDLTGLMSFELNPWHICISFFLGMVIVMVFFGTLQNHGSHDFQRQITIMHENHEKEMQSMHRQHEKQIQGMHERQLVIQKQTDLINAFTQIMHEIQRSTDQYVAGVREYSHLKEKDNSWLSSLSMEERDRMYRLEGLLGTDEDIDVRMAIAMVRQSFKYAEKFFSSQLEELEDALDRMDIEKMKQLQKKINKKHLKAHLQGATEQVKFGISTSRALQKSGVLSRIASGFYQALVTVISKIMAA